MQVIQTQKAKLGENHPHTLRSMCHLQVMYYDESQLEKAENLETQILEGCKAKLARDEDHLDTLSVLHDLASAYHHRERVKEAEKLFLQVNRGHLLLDTYRVLTYCI